MGSKKELEQQLDGLSPRPYKPTADLRELHRLYHKAAKIDEGAPLIVGKMDALHKVIAFARSIKPSSLGRALKLINEIEYEASTTGYEDAERVLRLALQIHLEHNPPNEIDHRY